MNGAQAFLLISQQIADLRTAVWAAVFTQAVIAVVLLALMLRAEWRSRPRAVKGGTVLEFDRKHWLRS